MHLYGTKMIYKNQTEKGRHAYHTTTIPPNHIPLVSDGISVLELTGCTSCRGDSTHWVCRKWIQQKQHWFSSVPVSRGNSGQDLCGTKWAEGSRWEVWRGHRKGQNLQLWVSEHHLIDLALTAVTGSSSNHRDYNYDRAFLIHCTFYHPSEASGSNWK